jgi:hypothetical protein
MIHPLEWALIIMVSVLLFTKQIKETNTKEINEI